MDLSNRFVTFLLAGLAMFGSYMFKQDRDDAMRELHDREMRAQATVLDVHRSSKYSGCWVDVLFKDEKGVAYFFGWPASYNKARAIYNDTRIVKIEPGLYASQLSGFVRCGKVSVIEVAYSKNQPEKAIVVDEERNRIPTIVTFIAGLVFFLMGIFRPGLMKGRNE
ncbi:hypothetical protein FACS1894116_09880 [Betaproteobacteria bacterium]|nr:hypothetical protein FACS1894116_09880 [Betaproteobacteria bacterium]GHU29433.1 hypothetical protein FACS189497_07400 [Betaproteobacteria bacterium]